jgi:hypothetical protein
MTNTVKYQLRFLEVIRSLTIESLFLFRSNDKKTSPLLIILNKLYSLPNYHFVKYKLNVPEFPP